MSGVGATATIVAGKATKVFIEVKITIKAIKVYCKRVDKYGKLARLGAKGYIRLADQLTKGFDKMAKVWEIARKKLVKEIDEGKLPIGVQASVMKAIHRLDQVRNTNDQWRRKLLEMGKDVANNVTEIEKLVREICAFNNEVDEVLSLF